MHQLIKLKAKTKQREDIEEIEQAVEHIINQIKEDKPIIAYNIKQKKAQESKMYLLKQMAKPTTEQSFKDKVFKLSKPQECISKYYYKSNIGLVMNDNGILSISRIDNTRSEHVELCNKKIIYKDQSQQKVDIKDVTQLIPVRFLPPPLNMINVLFYTH